MASPVLAGPDVGNGIASSLYKILKLPWRRQRLRAWPGTQVPITESDRVTCRWFDMLELARVGVHFAAYLGMCTRRYTLESFSNRRNPKWVSILIDMIAWCSAMKLRAWLEAFQTTNHIWACIVIIRRRKWISDFQCNRNQSGNASSNSAFARTFWCVVDVPLLTALAG